MSEAIIAGMIQSGVLPEQITALNTGRQIRLDYLHDTYGILTTLNLHKSVNEHDTIILCTPPDKVMGVLEEILPYIKDQLIVSVAAGIDTAMMEKVIPKRTATAWIMPNTAAQLGQSISPYTFKEDVSPSEQIEIRLIVNAIGEGYETTEKMVHQLTAITGSAPAYVYAFAEAMMKRTMAEGVNEAEAEKLVKAMMEGSIAMLGNGKSPAELMDQVASPGGSTREGLNVLEAGGFQELIGKAITAANEHAASNKS